MSENSSNKEKPRNIIREITKILIREGSYESSSMRENYILDQIKLASYGILDEIIVYTPKYREHFKSFSTRHSDGSGMLKDVLIADGKYIDRRNLTMYHDEVILMLLHDCIYSQMFTELPFYTVCVSKEGIKIFESIDKLNMCDIDDLIPKEDYLINIQFTPEERNEFCMRIVNNFANNFKNITQLERQIMTNPKKCRDYFIILVQELVKIKKYEKEISYYKTMKETEENLLRLEKLENIQDRIKAEDIAAISSKFETLDITHMNIIIKNKEKKKKLKNFIKKQEQTFREFKERNNPYIFVLISRIENGKISRRINGKFYRHQMKAKLIRFKFKKIIGSSALLRELKNQEPLDEIDIIPDSKMWNDLVGIESLIRKLSGFDIALNHILFDP